MYGFVHVCYPWLCCGIDVLLNSYTMSLQRCYELLLPSVCLTKTIKNEPWHRDVLFTRGTWEKRAGRIPKYVIRGSVNVDLNQIHQRRNFLSKINQRAGDNYEDNIQIREWLCTSPTNPTTCQNAFVSASFSIEVLFVLSFPPRPFLLVFFRLRLVPFLTHFFAPSLTFQQIGH